MQWVIAGVAAAVIISVLVGAMVWKANGGNDSAQAVPVATTTSTPASTTRTPWATPPAAPVPAPVPQAASCDGRSAGPSPQTPAGWQTVTSPRGLAYDVPPGFEVKDCKSLVGWEKACPETPDSPFGFCPIRMMSGATTLPNPTCPDGGSLVVTGVPGAKSVDSIDEAVRQESGVVKDIYTSESGAVPTVSLSEPRQLTVGGAPAVEVIATVSGISGDACTAPNALHAMVATTVPGQPGTALLVVSMEQGVAGAPEPGMLDQIVDSLRRTN